MAKTEVYSWRVTSGIKVELERAAKRANHSVARLLDNIVRQWLASIGSDSSDSAEQQRLHHAASKCVGVLRGGNPRRAEQARRTIRARLLSRRVGQRPD